MTIETIREVKRLLDEYGQPYCFGGSTLLAILRGEMIPNDTEVDIMTLDASKFENMTCVSKKTHDSLMGKGLLYIDLPQRITVASVFEYKDKELINPSDVLFYTFPKGTIFPFSTLSFDGGEVPVPHKPDVYASVQYGDWRTKQSQWHWTQSLNIRRLYE